MKTFLLIAAFTSSLAAQTPSYFPLEVGNTWTYRPSATNRIKNQDPRTITVRGKQTIAGRDYFQVTYFNREVLLRVEPTDASIVSYDTDSANEQPWLSLALPVGSAFPTTIDPCSTKGIIESRDAKALRVRFSGNCADAGLTQQLYAPNIGLTSWEETSFIGPVKFELAEYHVGSIDGGASEVAFTVAIDAPSYTSGATVQTRMTLKSTSATPIHLTFPSGQDYDLRILDQQGKVVYSWSKDKAFSQIFRQETFGPGDKTYNVSAPLGTLAPGIYKVEAWLTTSPVLYLGNVSFEVPAP